jgi:hypothetical protein
LKGINRVADPIRAISVGLFGGITAMLLHGLVEQSFKADIQLWYVVCAVCGLSLSIHRLSIQQAGKVPVTRII